MLLACLCLALSARGGNDEWSPGRSVTDLTPVEPIHTVLTQTLPVVSPTGTSSRARAQPASPHSASFSTTDGPDLSGKAFLSDNYQYANTAALLANISANAGGRGSPHTALYDDGPNAGRAVVDTNVTYNGHPTVRYDQLSGTSAGPEMWAGFRNGKTVTNMWLRAIIKFSPGFTTYGVTPNSANAYKLLGWGWAGTNGRGGLGFTNTNEYTFTWSVASLTGNNLGVTELTGPRTVTTEWSDGAWYDYVVHYEQTSATITRTSYYIGRSNATPVLIFTMNGAIKSGSSIPPVNRVMLGLNFNSTRVKSQALWYGQWEVVDGSQYANPFNLN